MFLRLEIIKKVIVFPLLLLAIPYGVIAICFVPMVHELVDLVLGTYYIRRLLGIHKTNPLKDYGIFLLYSIVSCLPAYLICCSALSPWLSLPIAILSAFGIYYLLLYRNDYLKDFIQIVKKL